MPKFSILVPVIKGKFLNFTIESVLKQTFSDWEMIVYNDFSSDNIDVIIEKYKDKRVQYSKGNKNIGSEDPSKVWNLMLKKARGKYIVLLGDDDYISENYLEEINHLTLNYPEISIFRTKLKRVDESGKIIFENENLPLFETWDQAFYARTVEKRTQSTSEFVLERKSLEKIGGYVNFPRACGSDDATYLLLMKEKGIASTNKAVAYWRKSNLNISDNDSQEVNEYKIKFILEWEKEFLDKIFSKNVPVSKLYKSIEDYLNLKKERIASEELHKIKTELENTKNKLSLIKNKLSNTRSKLVDKKNELNKVYNSREWKAGLKLSEFAHFVMPPRSYRRKIVVHSFRTVKSPVFLVKKTKDKLVQFSKYFKKIKPRKKRKINLKSKKLIYIGHSYHAKTKSSEFLINFLKKTCDVEVILSESWMGRSFPNLSFINESYLGVVFFQLLPSKEVIENIKNENIIYFPMYDQSGRLELDFWQEYRNLKVINFSETLHKKLQKWGFESMYIQFFPKPNNFFPGKRDEVFFWQRLSFLNIKTVISLFKKEKVKIHLHKAVDPGQEFVKPNAEEEKKFQITSSDWFETREEMWDLIKQKAVYVAPREYEGIGMSFLEAMAMGKAVVAADNPTMNEYIEHGKTGYLFDLKNPKKVDLSNIEQVQKNTYEFMKEGYENWMKNRKNIIDFIKKP